MKRQPMRPPPRRLFPSLNAPRVFPECRLKEVREALDMNQQQAAAIIGMAPSNLWKLEQGTNVKLSYARKIARAYGKSLDELWPEPEEKGKA